MTFGDLLREMRFAPIATADEARDFLQAAHSGLAQFDRRVLVDCSEALDHMQEACDAMAAAPIVDAADVVGARESWRDRRAA